MRALRMIVSCYQNITKGMEACNEPESTELDDYGMPYITATLERNGETMKDIGVKTRFKNYFFLFIYLFNKYWFFDQHKKWA